MNVRALVSAIFLALPGWAGAQGFAGLGQAADGYALPSPETQLRFPADHGPHPGFRIEWWYLTANLRGEDGRDYGVQWTLFRSALAPGDAGGSGWRAPQAWLGHAGLTTPDAHYSAERLARGGVGLAGVTTTPFDAWIDDWQMQGTADISTLNLNASGAEFAYDLSLNADGPLVAHGDGGYSVKSASGQASFYYSQPFYRVRGTLTLPHGPVAVTGQAWLDREWSSQPLAADQDGWDWVSLHLDNGAKLMGFRLRHTGGAHFHSGTWISADGTATALTPDALTLTPLDHTTTAGRQVPVGWRLRLPARNVDVRITALNPDSWMATSVPYWEGPVTVTGSHAGRGYLEMTGYE